MVGTVTLSIEVELGWSSLRTTSADESNVSTGRERETEFLHRLLDISDECDVPITFDVVGHLLQNACSGEHAGPYTDPTWFDIDPGTDVDTDPLFYAPDLVEAILDAETNHEIGTHTYSHIHCDDESTETLAHELETTAYAHKAFGLDEPVSFVPPNHERASKGTLSEAGIEVMRTPFPTYPRPDGGFRYTYWVLSRSHPVAPSERHDGILETYCAPHPSLTAGSLPEGTCSPSAEYRLIPRRLRQRLHYGYLVDAVESAIESDSEVHLWTHLYNMANDAQWRPIRAFLERLGELRDAGHVDIVSMRGLVDA